MRCFRTLWRNLTQRALDQSSGKYETAFFESVYRITYFTGHTIMYLPLLRTTAANSISGLSFFEQRLQYRLYRITGMVVIVLFVSSELWYLFSMGPSLGLDGVIESINVTTIHLIVMYRYKRMTDDKEIYSRLASSMESKHFDISTPNRKKLLKFWVDTNEKYFYYVLGLGTCTLAFWYVYPLVDGEEYTFSVGLILPFDYKYADTFPITFLVVFLMFHYISYFVIENDLIMPAYLMHLLCQFSILGDCFENIITDCRVGLEDIEENKLFLNKRFRQKFTNRLNDLVEQHKFILKNGMELREILSAPMLGQLIASAMLICLAGYQVTMSMSVSIVKLLMSIGYLTYNMYALYITCRWCDEVKMQSENIGKAVYFSGWERGIMVVPGMRTRLMLVVARTARPIILTAGGLYDLSLMSYTNLVKTSYSALTVLLRMRKRN